MSDTIDQANEIFWDELCGSDFAKSLGIQDHSNEALKKFDAAYFDFFPYLMRHIDFYGFAGKKILEVGLGYGTVGQKIAEHATEYVGLDIAGGPVAMMNHRLSMHNLNGKAVKGSILNCPMDSASFDSVVSIGCFHHTGNVQRCIDEAYRVLKPGGTLVMMVYNRFSYVQWIKWPIVTFKSLISNKQGALESQKMFYDRNAAGSAAPETIFLSIKELQKMLAQFSNIKFTKENSTALKVGKKILISRKRFLTNLAKIAGIDIYVKATK